MNTAGIIGGLGPETTADFYLKINQLAYQYHRTVKPSCIVSNVEIPFATEQSLLLKGGAVINDYLPYLKNSISQLEKAGAKFIVIPCNTVHILIDDLRKFATIPIISIIEVTKFALNKANIKNAYLLATSTTINEGLYNNNDIEWTIPTSDQQKVVDRIISNLVNGSFTDQDRKELKSIISHDTVLLACSDLHIALKDMSGITLFDTMEILARKTVESIYDKDLND